MWFSELVPNMARHADRWCMIRSMHTEQINHDPAITFFKQVIIGRSPKYWIWLSYGLGSDNADLPAYIVLTSYGSGRPNDQPSMIDCGGRDSCQISIKGFAFATQVPQFFILLIHLVSRDLRRATLDRIAAINASRAAIIGDPDIASRTSQYEMAFRMQASVPEIADFSDEPKHVLESYGPDVSRHGSYAYNCLLARRLSERGVRFVQCFHGLGSSWRTTKGNPGSSEGYGSGNRSFAGRS